MLRMYSVRENPPDAVRDALGTYDPLTARLLYARGITTPEEADAFFRREWLDADPYVYADMRKAAERMLRAVADGERIGIYSDYDCDGIPAAAALYSTLRAFRHDDVMHYVPDRNGEGFGLHAGGIRHLVDGGATVVCILDCGTSDPDAVALLTAAGIDVIIIDHHLPPETGAASPFAMLNPTLEDIPEPHPCAAGITYLFIRSLILLAAERSLPVRPAVGWEKWQLDIVGLATLSDMVPLRGLNRQFAHYGLLVMRKSPRPGIYALCESVKIKQERITQDDMSFLIVPRINAASRMGDAGIAFRLLTTDDIAEARECAARLAALNDRRKTAVATMVREAKRQAETKDREKSVWVFGSRAWKPSLAGLVAQRLMESYDKTVFVWGRGGADDSAFIRGSCRSRVHDTFSLMRAVPDLFVESGGHARAGGFTLAEAAELTLEDGLNAVRHETPTPSHGIVIDGECAVRDIRDILSLCERFAPFGKDNEQVHIAIPKCTVRKQTWFGKNREHIRYTFADDTGEVDGISFFASREEDSETSERAVLRAVLGKPEWDMFRGRPRIRVIHLVR